MNLMIRKLVVFFTAFLAVFLGAGALYAQSAACPAGSQLYVYTGKPLTQLWYDYNGGPDPNGKNPFKTINGYICVPVGRCRQFLTDVTQLVTDFSFSSGGYTVSKSSPDLTVAQTSFYLRCDADGNVSGWSLQAARGFPGTCNGVFGFGTMTMGGDCRGAPSGHCNFPYPNDSAEASKCDPDGKDTFIGGASPPLGDPGDWRTNVECADFLNGFVSLNVTGPTITAVFTPPGDLHVAANVCGVDHFNWQQTINYLPAPNSSITLPNPPGLMLTAPPRIFDPAPKGVIDYSQHYVQCRGKEWAVTSPAVDLSYPFYYSDAELSHMATADQLTFQDSPSDPCMSGNDPSGNPGIAHTEFTTWLVGVDQFGLPVSLPVLNSWDWLSTWNGSSGGAYGIKNLNLPDPGSGTGGTTVLSINGVPTRGTCASNTTASVTVKRGGYVYSIGTGRFTQTVTLTNTSAGTLNGPVSLVLDKLTNGVSLYNAGGVTYCTEPVGSAYLSEPGDLKSGQSVNFTLQFTDPTKTGISYTPRVLSGLGPQ